MYCVDDLVHVIFKYLSGYTNPNPIGYESSLSYDNVGRNALK